MIPKRFLLISLFLSLLITFAKTNGSFLNFNSESEKNQLEFLESEKDLDYGEEIVDFSHHRAKYRFVIGFLHGIQIFNNVTHFRNCVSIFSEIRNDAEEVIDNFHNATTYEDMIRAARVLIDRLERFGKKLDDVEPNCRILIGDVGNALGRVNRYYQREHQVNNLIAHSVANVGTIFGKCQCVKANIKSNHFFRAGWAYGDLIHYIFLWDLDSQKSALKLDLEKYGESSNFDFNIPPFKFE